MFGSILPNKCEKSSWNLEEKTDNFLGTIVCNLVSFWSIVFFSASFFCCNRMRNTGTDGTKTMRQRNAHAMPAASRRTRSPSGQPSWRRRMLSCARKWPISARNLLVTAASSLSMNLNMAPYKTCSWDVALFSTAPSPRWLGRPGFQPWSLSFQTGQTDNQQQMFGRRGKV